MFVSGDIETYLREHNNEVDILDDYPITVTFDRFTREGTPRVGGEKFCTQLILNMR